MELIADVLLIGGALAAAIYCVVLSRRLRRFTDLEKGVGGAIAVLSAQVDDMTKTLSSAQVSAIDSAKSLDRLTSRAESVARRLELLVASMHDIPDIPGKNRMPELAAAPPSPETLETETPEAETPVADTAKETLQTEPPAPAAVPDSSPLFLSTRNRVSEAAE